MIDYVDNNDTKTQAFKAFKHDFQMAKKAKTRIDDLISEWNDLYYGKTKSTSTKIKLKSKVVMKEIAKQIEWQKPNITEPFLSTSNPIRITRNSTNSNTIENYLNTHFTSSFNRTDFMEQLVDVLLREGTVWVRDGWISKKKNTTEFFNLTMEEVLARPDEPTSIKQIENGLFEVEYANTSLDRNEPTSRICRNEFAFPDPGAKTVDELRFFAEERLMTISELRASGFYPEDKINLLVSKIKENDSDYSSLKNQRDDDGEDYGQDRNYQPEDDPRKKVSIIEYWGFYDLNGDGIAEPILATWAKNEDVNLSIEDNPLPKQNIPYNNVVYSARPFSLWGNALAYFIGDNQKIKTGILRGIMDNMSLANNGQKFVRRGSLDYVNFKRMRNGERHIVVNKDLDGAIKDGSYNNLPNSIFQTLSMITTENEQLSGVSAGGPSLSNDNLAKDDTANMQMTMSQQRMAALVRNVSNLLGKMMHNWITMAEVFLSNEQIERLFSESEQIDYYAFKNANQTHISFKVGTDVNRIMKMQQLNMLLQQSKQLQENIPPEHLNYLVAEMYELFDMYDKAREIREYKPQPNPMQQKAMQLDLEAKHLANKKLQAEIQSTLAKMQADGIRSQKDLIDAQAGAMYKEAQAAEKYAKTEEHKVNSALKPAEFVVNQQQQQQRSI